eukprot:TRINITY_DN924_c0_g1_i1.p1 TRINITY_DN924_c0_g1~~TRINITY_DN924_c0_g1_i1.p1  ORF type:complete len:192 (-),score=29.30 TRINITY_DN924_c0_g1_i1:226-801(-)
MAAYSERGSAEGRSTWRRSLEACLRVFAAGLCVAGMVLMLKNKIVGQYSTLEYRQIRAFEYLTYASGAAAGYSMISAVGSVVAHDCRGYRSWILLLLDQGFTYVILSAGAAATEVLYVAYRGEPEATWFAACQGGTRPFCNKATASVVSTFCALLCLLCLSILSSYRVFSKYDPPLQMNKDDSYPSVPASG